MSLIHIFSSILADSFAFSEESLIFTIFSDRVESFSNNFSTFPLTSCNVLSSKLELSGFVVGVSRFLTGSDLISIFFSVLFFLKNILITPKYKLYNLKKFIFYENNIKETQCE